MANYLLLRNNKESGPFSFDDLMEMGLKPYDLVWVQGKSAAWRYPSEVEELKPFAPIVEEQPFDRFFKRPAETKKAETVKQELPVVAPEYEKYIPKKSVFVAMPVQKNTPVQSVRKEETVPTPVPVQQTITISENPAASQIKYSQPLDEIKDMYVKTLQDRKQKIARKSFWLQTLKKAAVVLSFIAIGVIVGFVLKSNADKKQEIAQKKEKVSASVPTVTDPAVNTRDTNLSSVSAEKVNPASLRESEFVNKVPEPEDQGSTAKQIIEKPVNLNGKKKSLSPAPANDISNDLVARSVDINPATGERIRKLRDENNTNNASANDNALRSVLSNELSGLVSVKSNDYKKVAFGGIRDLQLTVTNESKFILDNVTVELQYLKPSEQPLRTENIQFTSVGPKATSTIRIPDTNRGIKVVYRIVNIRSRQMDEGVAGN